MSEIKRCPICKRIKNQAIQEQSAKKEHCGVVGCVFSKQIIEAIQKKRSPKIVKKPTKNIVVIKRETKTIKINKK